MYSFLQSRLPHALSHTPSEYVQFPKTSDPFSLYLEVLQLHEAKLLLHICCSCFVSCRNWNTIQHVEQSGAILSDTREDVPISFAYLLPYCLIPQEAHTFGISLQVQ